MHSINNKNNIVKIIQNRTRYESDKWISAVLNLYNCNVCIQQFTRNQIIQLSLSKSFLTTTLGLDSAQRRSSYAMHTYMHAYIQHTTLTYPRGSLKYLASHSQLYCIVITYMPVVQDTRWTGTVQYTYTRNLQAALQSCSLYFQFPFKKLKIFGQRNGHSIIIMHNTHHTHTA